MSFHRHRPFNQAHNFRPSSNEDHVEDLLPFVQPATSHLSGRDNLPMSKRETKPEIFSVSCNSNVPPPVSFIDEFNIRPADLLSCENEHLRSRFLRPPAPPVVSYLTNIPPPPIAPGNHFNRSQPRFHCPTTVTNNSNKSLSENIFHLVPPPPLPNLDQNHSSPTISIENLNINLRKPPPSASSCMKFSFEKPPPIRGEPSTIALQNHLSSSFVVDNNFRTIPPPFSKHSMPPPPSHLSSSRNNFAERQCPPPNLSISHQTKMHPPLSVDNKNNSMNKHSINHMNNDNSMSNHTSINNQIDLTNNINNHINNPPRIVPKTCENIRRPSCQFSSSNTPPPFRHQSFSNSSLSLNMNVPPPIFSVPPPNVKIHTLDRSSENGNNFRSEMTVKTESPQPSCSFTINNNSSQYNHSDSTIINNDFIQYHDHDSTTNNSDLAPYNHSDSTIINNNSSQHNHSDSSVFNNNLAQYIHSDNTIITNESNQYNHSDSLIINNNLTQYNHSNCIIINNSLTQYNHSDSSSKKVNEHCESTVQKFSLESKKRNVEDDDDERRRKRRRASRSKSKEQNGERRNRKSRQRSTTRDSEKYRRNSRERRRRLNGKHENRDRSPYSRRNCENGRLKHRRQSSRERKSRRSNSRESKRYDRNRSNLSHLRSRSRSNSRQRCDKNIYLNDCSRRRKRSYSNDLSSNSSSERIITMNDRLSNEPSLSSNHSSDRNELSLTNTNDSIVEKWRLNNCLNEDEMLKEFNLKATMDADTIIEIESKIWSRSAPADLYYELNKTNFNFESTNRVNEICAKFETLLKSIDDVKKSRPKFDYTSNRLKSKCVHCKNDQNSSDDENEDIDEVVTTQNKMIDKERGEDNWMKEWQLKEKHPYRVHPDLWFNDEGEMNDGPLCRCSNKSRRSGIRHNIYQGETRQCCDINSNNSDKLYHYRITFSPPTNFLVNKPTIITFDGHEYIFEGFSLFSHYKLDKLPTCKVIRFNIQYTIVYIEEKVPSSYSIKEIDLFFKYLFYDILELVDLDLHCPSSSGESDSVHRGCPQFHLMPRFVRELENNGKELIPMYKIIEFFTESYSPVICEDLVNNRNKLSAYEWQNFVDSIRGMIVIKPGSKPSSIRVDQLDRVSENNDSYPDIIHFGIRPPQLSYTGNTQYQKLWKEYVKFRHLIANKRKKSDDDRRKLADKQEKLQKIRNNSEMKRGVTVALSSRGFIRTGIMCDMVQHAMLIPVLICHLRFHRSLNILEERIGYEFRNRYYLQLALTHPSYRENFGTNPDHARNSLTNCGIRQPEYGDRKIHFQNTRKRGINTLISIMSKLGEQIATESNISHNERLEFLGDAVVEFVTSIHLFHTFPHIEEGGLATYRASIVENQNLAALGKKIGLEQFMLYAHGSDLCHELELKHAMANCFEALMGALFLDGDIQVADDVFSKIMFADDPQIYNQWMLLPKHPLQEQEPEDDRRWVQKSPILKLLQNFERLTGITFRHIRLLARVFTTRSLGYTNLTLGSNQRLEFLGDTVLQLITSAYLYNHFPEHHEGHLSLLRSSLVNNKTQSVVCNDIGMPSFAIEINPKLDLKMKDRADLLEALLGAMYIDKGMEACEQFCHVLFFPRLQYFILNQEWNDPKSKLQQCCLTLRTLNGGEPDIPIYKVIECKGPTNSRLYTVGVYFQNARLASCTGSSIQQAEMNAAKKALKNSTNIFPQLEHQKRVIAKTIQQQTTREGVATP